MDKKVLYTVIDSFSEEFKHQVAIEEKGNNITYGDLKKHTDFIAGLLAAFGIGRKSIVAVFLPSSIDYIRIILSVNKAGGVFMPLDPDYPKQRTNLLIKEVVPEMIISRYEYKDRLISLMNESKWEQGLIGFLAYDTEPSLEIWQFKNGKMQRLKAPEVIPPVLQMVNGNDTNYLIYTSGSTGTPKIIKGSHKGLSHFIHWEVKTFGFNKTCKVSQLAPVTFDVSLRDIFVPLLAGGTLCIPEKENRIDPQLLLQWIGDAGITVIHTVPSIFKLITKRLQNENNIKHIKNLTHVLLAGEPLYGKDVKRWYETVKDVVQLVNLYGPSETTLAKMYHLIDFEQIHYTIMPLGKPLPNTSIIIESQGQLCNKGAVGEILIKSPFRSNGYFKNERLNSEKFIQNPLHNEFEDIVYRTGDFGKYLENGAVVFMGRQDGQIKIRGNRVEIGEIEGVLSRLNEIDEVVITVHENSSNENVLICYYISEEPIVIREVRNHLMEILPEYMIPSYFLQLDTFPLNFNGKIHRIKLPLPYELVYENLPYETPITTLEKQLANCWQEILNLKKVGRNNSFFELGGHSLSATKLVTKIAEVTGKQLSLKDFFENDNIASLALFLNESVEIQNSQIPRIAKQKKYMASNAQQSIWAFQQTFRNKYLYNMNGLYEVRKSVNIPILKKAVGAIVKRHEVLRTFFCVEKGIPKQVVMHKVKIPFYFKDYSTSDVSEEQLKIKSLLRQPFNLNEAPLFKIYLLDFGKESFQLLFVIHHIICDGWSGSIIINELASIYESLVRNESLKLKELKLQYKDYTYWQYENKNSLNYQKQTQFWIKKLKHNLLPLKLPFDHLNVIQETYIGRKHFFKFDKTSSREIRDYIKSERVSLFVFMTALIKVLLYKFCNQKEICVGMPIATRNHQDLKNQIGMYLNFLVLYDEVDIGTTKKMFLHKINHTVKEAMEHMDFSYDELVTLLNSENKNSSLEALYNVLIVMNNHELNGADKDFDKLSDLMSLKRLFLDDEISKLPLTFFIDDELELGITVEYSTELFNEDTIHTLCDNLKLISTLYIQDSNVSLKELLGNTNDSYVFEEMPLEDF